MNSDFTRPAPPEADLTRTQGELPTRTGELPKDESSVVPHASTAAGAVDAPPGFAIEREIGVGGMGVVYLAKQAGLNRPVALKVVKGGTKVAGKAMIRFLAEAEAVASIKHPNVVEVYQYGEHAGQPYMALEFCPGGDMTKLVHGVARTSAADFRRVADLMAKVADGVNAAHAQGIVHRDLKPHNVFLTADGTPKVADFGLAKRGIGRDLTNTQAVLGTPAYMSPEQAGGGTKFVGPEADVWALGVMLYELACGERPIDTSGPLLDAIARVAKGDVSQLRTKAPTTPLDLTLIVHKCLSTDPRDRYPTAGGLAQDLRNWLDGKPISARPAGIIEQAVKWAKRNKKLAGMGLGVLLTMATATGVSLGFGLEASRQSELALAQERRTDEKAAALAEALAVSEEQVYSATLKEAMRARDVGNAAEADRLLRVCPPRCRGWEYGYLTSLSSLRSVPLQLHTTMVDGVALSPDGRMIASNARDGTLKVSDVRTGRVVLTLPVGGEGAHYLKLAFSPDGAVLASSSADKTVRLWESGTGRPVATLLGHEGVVTGVAFSPDGAVLASSSADKTVRLWDANSHGVVFTLAEHEAGVLGVAFSPDGRRVASASDDRTVRVWDVRTGKRGLLLDGHFDRVYCVTLSPDGTQIVTGTRDGVIRVFDAFSGMQVRTLTGHTGWISGLAFAPEGRRLVSSSSDHTLRVWNLGDEIEPPRVVVRHGGSKIFSADFSPDGSRFATAADDGSLRIWSVQTGRSELALRGHEGRIWSVRFGPTGRQIATASRDQTVKVWDAQTGQCLATLSGHRKAVRGLAFSPDGTRIASASDDLTVRIWDWRTGGLEQNVDCGAECLSVTYSPNGRHVAVGTHAAEPGKAVWVLDARTGQTVNRFGPVMREVYGISYSPDGSRVLTGSWDHTVRTFDAATGVLLRTLESHTNGVWSVAVHPSGSRLASGSQDRTVRVWDAVSGNMLISLAEHARDVTAVTFSPDGEKLASASSDGTAVLRSMSPSTRTDTERLTDWDRSDPSWHRSRLSDALNRGNHYAAASHMSLLADLEINAPAQFSARAGHFWLEADEPQKAAAQFLRAVLLDGAVDLKRPAVLNVPDELHLP